MCPTSHGGRLLFLLRLVYFLFFFFSFFFFPSLIGMADFTWREGAAKFITFYAFFFLSQN